MAQKLMDWHPDKLFSVDPADLGYDEAESTIRLRWRIDEVEQNLFYYEPTSNQPFNPDKGMKHWQLSLLSETAWTEDLKETSLEFEPKDHPLTFTLSFLDKPTPEQFLSKALHEVRCAVFTVQDFRNCGRWQGVCRRSLEIEDLYTYMTLKGDPKRGSTKYLIQHKNHIEDCLYQTQKWFFYLLGISTIDGLTCDNVRWESPVGDLMMEWLDVESRPGSKIEKIRGELKAV